MSISYIKYRDIDTGKWDKCIVQSFNASIYAFSWYLDILCEEWDALVEGNYISVMPLVTSRIMGQNIIYTPGLVKELGIFSKKPVPAEKTELFLNSIPPRFDYYHIILNKYNPLKPDRSIYRKRVHYNLDLIEPYYKLVRNFTPELRQKINLAVARRLSFIKSLSPNDFILFLQRHCIHVDRAIRIKNYRILRSMIASLIRNNAGDLYGVYNEHNDLASVALFAWISNRIILLFLAVDPEQIRDQPHLYLIDRIIDKYSETNSTLSFHFSSRVLTPEVYSSFGANEIGLNEVASGRMPFYLRPFMRSIG